MYKVEPPSRGHFGANHFVPSERLPSNLSSISILCEDIKYVRVSFICGSTVNRMDNVHVQEQE